MGSCRGLNDAKWRGLDVRPIDEAYAPALRAVTVGDVAHPTSS